jgi:hypothetical protein
MNISQLWAEIENEHLWRMNEIRFFQNMLPVDQPGIKQDQFRRALILILYAHFEGFCKFTFLLYVNSVNSEGVTCAQANFAIAAASLSTVFADLRHPDKKCPEFRNSLPDDSKLHRFARDREFGSSGMAVKAPNSLCHQCAKAS